MVQPNTTMDGYPAPPSKPAFPPAYTGAKKRSTKAWRAWAGDHPEDAKVFNEAMAAYYAERKAWWKECEERVLCAFCPTLYFGRYGEKNTPMCERHKNDCGYCFCGEQKTDCEDHREGEAEDKDEDGDKDEDEEDEEDEEDKIICYECEAPATHTMSNGEYHYCDAHYQPCGECAKCGIEMNETWELGFYDCGILCRPCGKDHDWEGCEVCEEAKDKDDNFTSK